MIINRLLILFLLLITNFITLEVSSKITNAISIKVGNSIITTVDIQNAIITNLVISLGFSKEDSDKKRV